MELLNAVTRNGYALQYVQHQTPEICLAAVTQLGDALMYVRKQTPEICLAAVTQDGEALMYVQEQTPLLCLAAVTRHGGSLVFVKEQTPEICLAAARQTKWKVGWINDTLKGYLSKKYFERWFDRVDTKVWSNPHHLVGYSRLMKIFEE